MRKLVLLFAPATLALVALMACEDDSSGGGGNFSFDASLSDFNAPPPNDGGPIPETSTDAVPDAPAVPSVNVTVTDSRGPKSGVRIVFHDATGAVIETKLTGNDGKATHIGAAAMASALLVRGSQRHIVTWTGVELGDDLQVRDEDSGQESGLYTVTLTSLFAPGMNFYRFEGPCGVSQGENYGTAAELPLYPFCTRAQNAVLVTARSLSGTLLGHTFKKGNPGIADGGTVSITTGAAWNAPSSLAVNVTNVPARTPFDPQLLEIADGAGFRNESSQTENSLVTFSTAAGFADAYQASAWFGSNGGAERIIAKRFAPAAVGVTLDYTTLLPQITDATIDTSIPRRPVLSWTASTAGTDGGLVRFWFTGPEEASYDWTFVVAPGSTTVTGPAMPAEAESFLPRGPDAGVPSVFGRPELLFVESDVLPSYASFRGLQGSILGLNEAGFVGYSLPALPTNGTYRTTSWTERTE